MSKEVKTEEEADPLNNITGLSESKKQMLRQLNKKFEDEKEQKLKESQEDVIPVKVMIN